MQQLRKVHFSFLALLVLLLQTVFLHLAAGRSLAEDLLTIAGTGDSEFLLQHVAEAFMQKRPEIRVDVPSSIGSSGGILGLLQNSFELARTARPLKTEEQDGSLVEFVFAASPVVFAVHPSVTGVKELTTKEILGIYDGTLTLWSQLGGPPSRIYPLDRERGDSSRTVLESHMQGFRDITSVAKICYTTPEIAETLALHKFTIGFLPYGVARESQLLILGVDGASPDSGAIKKCTYPYITSFAVVGRHPLSARARLFVDFLFSPEARSIIQQCGFVPLEKKT